MAVRDGSVSVRLGVTNKPLSRDISNTVTIMKSYFHSYHHHHVLTWLDLDTD